MPVNRYIEPSINDFLLGGMVSPPPFKMSSNVHPYPTRRLIALGLLDFRSVKSDHEESPW